MTHEREVSMRSKCERFAMIAKRVRKSCGRGVDFQRSSTESFSNCVCLSARSRPYGLSLENQDHGRGLPENLIAQLPLAVTSPNN
jgi:hypothetical protein